MVFIHQEADRAAVHAVDLLARAHRLAQRLKQKSIAAQRHDDIGLVDGNMPVAG
jgi:hypothetical protein